MDAINNKTDEACCYCGVSGGFDLYCHTVGPSISGDRQWDHELCELLNEACTYAFFLAAYGSPGPT